MENLPNRTKNQQKTRVNLTNYLTNNQRESRASAKNHF